MNMSITKSILLKLHPNTDERKAALLADLWDGVVERTIGRMLDLAHPAMREIHGDLREEMIFELAKLQIHIGNKIVEERLANRLPSDIDIADESACCFGQIGLEKIESTAHILAKHVWLKKYNERWKPKTSAALRREKCPKRPKLAVEPKVKNHFIPKSFIRRYWSKDGKVLRFKFDPQRQLSHKTISLGKWGFLKNLYSDRMEAYFSLVEGDAVRPIAMLLNVEPLNRKQKESLVGFMVIQRLRNPVVMEAVRSQMQPLIVGYVDQDRCTETEHIRRVYESLYENSDFYDRVARPILKNEWAVVRSNEEAFILPDTCVIFGDCDEGRYVVAPITPTDCLIVLPTENKVNRTIPHYVQANQELARDLTAFLLSHVSGEFLAGFTFVKPPDMSEERGPIIQRILSCVARSTSHEYLAHGESNA